MLDEFSAKQKIVTYAASIFNRGLTSGASANMSVRIDNGWVITPTNTCFGFLNADELAVVDLEVEMVAGVGQLALPARVNLLDGPDLADKVPVAVHGLLKDSGRQGREPSSSRRV